MLNNESSSSRLLFVGRATRLSFRNSKLSKNLHARKETDSKSSLLFLVFSSLFFSVYNNFAIEWFSAAPDILLVASLCLKMLEQSYKEHGLLYLCWCMLMIWYYTAQKLKFSIKNFFAEEILNGKLHFLCSIIQTFMFSPKDHLIWICLHPLSFFFSILWRSSTFWFTGFNLDIMPGFFLVHTATKITKKKKNRNKN